MFMQSTSQKSRLDMGHGFMKIIVKNQFDRDNYDREMKAAEKLPIHNSQPSYPRRPDKGTYVLPMHRNRTGDDVLYHLEYEDEYYNVHHVTLYENSDIRAVGKKFAEDIGLLGPMAKALLTRMLEETWKRRKSPDDGE